jgi:hypothetical protein
MASSPDARLSSPVVLALRANAPLAMLSLPVVFEPSASREAVGPPAAALLLESK